MLNNFRTFYNLILINSDVKMPKNLIEKQQNIAVYGLVDAKD